jgi:hypothetical protein
MRSRPEGRKEEMFKVPKQACTAEFKMAAVQRVKDGQSVSDAAHQREALNAAA